MSHAALGALGTAAYALTSSNIWSLADRMSAPRLVALLLISVTLTTVALIVAHGLWEHTSAPSARERVVLFNLATSVTLALATAALYAALFVISLLAAAVFIPPAALEENIRHATGIGDYVQLSWLVASIATLGGALGSLVDSDEGVRSAVYHPRPSDDEHATTWAEAYRSKARALAWASVSTRGGRRAAPLGRDAARQPPRTHEPSRDPPRTDRAHGSRSPSASPWLLRGRRSGYGAPTAELLVSHPLKPP